MTHCLYDVACARFSLRSEHSCSFCDTTKSLTEITTTTDKGDFEVILVDVVLLVCHRQHL